MGRTFDLVRVNKEAIKKDLATYGMNANVFSEKCGKSRNWLCHMFSNGIVDRNTVAFVEERMFKEPGAYCIEIDKEEPKKEEPKKEEKVSEGTGIILKQILQAINALADSTKTIDRKMAEMMKAIRETQAAQELLMQEMLQKEKEICTLTAKLLSATERRA